MAPPLIPSSFMPPIAPDFHHCNEFYSMPIRPSFEDCIQAFNLLPSGRQPEAYYTLPPSWEPNRLPFEVTYGSCSITIDASGKFVEDYTTKFWVVPDMIRHMVGWVIDQCVDGEKLGGYVTKDIKKTTDYLSAPGTKLWKPMPESITFFTAMVSDTNAEPFPEKYEPGCCDIATGIQIANMLYESYDRAPLNSALGEDLWSRYKLVDDAIVEMDDGGGLVPWWDKFPSRPSVLNGISVLNSTLRRPERNTSSIDHQLHSDS